MKILSNAVTEPGPAKTGAAPSGKALSEPVQLAELRQQPAPDFKPMLDAFMQEVRGEIAELKARIAKIQLPVLSPAQPAPDFKPVMDSFMQEVRKEMQELKERVAKTQLPIGASPAGVPPEDLKPLLETLKQQTSEQIQDLKTRLEALPKADPTLPLTLSSLSVRVDQLAAELTDFRKPVQEPPKKVEEKRSETPASPAPAPAAAEKRDEFSSRSAGSPASTNPPERKVAFTTKLWDYLNEAPFGKKQD